MEILDKNHRFIVSTTFPHEIFLKICEESGNSIGEIKGAKDFTHEQIHKVFMLALNKFIKGDIYTEQLADIANYLSNIFLSSNPSKGKLWDALYAAAELTYYIRTVETNHTLEKFRDRALLYYRSFSGKPSHQP